MERESKSLKEHVVHLKMKLTGKAFAFVCSRNTFIAVVIILVLIIGGAGGIAFTCRPQFCSYCHEMKPQIDSWKVSTHRNVNCIACHVEPGLVALLKDKLTVAPKSLFLKITGNYEKPINEESKLSEHMSNESCLQCHPMAREVTPSPGLIISHEAHKKINMKCAQCHNRVAHNIKGYENHLSEEYCFTCHNGVALKNNCELCHTSSFLAKNKNKRSGSQKSSE